MVFRLGRAPLFNTFRLNSMCRIEMCTIKLLPKCGGKGVFAIEMCRKKFVDEC